MKISQLGLTPNQVYYLNCVKTGETPTTINVDQEFRIALANNLIDYSKKLTISGALMLDRAEGISVPRESKKKQPNVKKLTGDDVKFVEKYRTLFPSGIHPATKSTPYRSTKPELLDKFEKFFKMFPENADWDLILQVSGDYNEIDQEHKMTSNNFILKEEKGQPIRSKLADLCDYYRENPGDAQDKQKLESFCKMGATSYASEEE